MSKLVVSISKSSDSTRVEVYSTALMADGAFRVTPLSFTVQADEVEVIDARPIVEPARRRKSRAKDPTRLDTALPFGQQQARRPAAAAEDHS